MSATEIPYAAHYYVPTVRPFRLWKFGARYNLFGEYVDDGWYVDRYGRREITRGEALRLTEARARPSRSR